MATYNLVIDDDRLDLKPGVLFKMYGDMDAQARQLADAGIRHELRISRDGRIKTRFYIAVSDRMAPHLLSAVQKQAESESGIGLKTYLHRLEEQLMAQMFAGASDQINVRFG
ncbi:MAG: hypothetical protein QXJ74_08080 [Nitrososphaera sp.]|uniref:hypothetical protein n=1 Tax=Nitrososphaera sp. TaxID=1971748 RepID=UPI00316D88E4